MHNDIQSEQKKNIILQVILVVATFLMYVHTLEYSFLKDWDDSLHFLNVTTRLICSQENIIYWLTHSHLANYFPLTMFSFMVDYNLWGLNEVGYHLQNIFWHIVAVLGIYNCFVYFKIKPYIALFLSLIFSIHPQRIESVVWISERKDVMCAAFYFWSIFLYIKSTNKKIFYLLSIICFIASLLSKAMAISLPMILLCYEFHKCQKIQVKLFIKKLWPYFLVTIILTTVAISCQMLTYGVIDSFLRRLIVPWHNYVWYIKTLFFPFDLSPMYPLLTFNTSLIVKTAIVYIFFIILFFAIFVYNRRIFTYTLLPITGCYIFSLAPVSGIYDLRFINYADRYSYIPSVFILFCLALFLTNTDRLASFNTSDSFKGLVGFLEKTLSNSKLLTIMGGVLILLMAVTNWYYAQTWKNDRLLFAAACINTERVNPIILSYWGKVELQHNNLNRAMQIADRLENFRDGWMNEENISGNKIKAYYLKARIYFRAGRRLQALKIYKTIKPLYKNTSYYRPADYTLILAEMADCYWKSGRISKAQQCYDELIDHLKTGGFKADTRFELYFYSGMRHLLSRQFKKSIEMFEKAQTFHPEDKNLKYNLDCARKLMEKNH